MIAARDDGLIESIGVSNVTLAHLLHALQVTAVACVDNLDIRAMRRLDAV